MTDITVRDAPEQSRFEIYVDGEFAGMSAYRIDDGKVLLPRVEVLPQFRNQGIASELVRQSLDMIRDEKWGTVVTMCPYADAWIKRHPEYQDMAEGA